MEPLFDHEKLDVYCVELQFTAWNADFLEDVSESSAQRRRELIEQLDRASLSMLLNTAEGNGKRHGRNRARFFDDAPWLSIRMCRLPRRIGREALRLR